MLRKTGKATGKATGTATGDSTDSADESDRTPYVNGTKLFMKMENDKGAFIKCAEVHAIDDEVEFPVELYDAKVLVRFAARSVCATMPIIILFIHARRSTTTRSQRPATMSL